MSVQAFSFLYIWASGSYQANLPAALCLAHRTLTATCLPAHLLAIQTAVDHERLWEGLCHSFLQESRLLAWSEEAASDCLHGERWEELGLFHTWLRSKRPYSNAIVD